MRKYRCLLAAMLLLLTGCGRGSVPADVQTAAPDKVQDVSKTGDVTLSVPDGENKNSRQESGGQESDGQENGRQESGGQKTAGQETGGEGEKRKEPVLVDIWVSYQYLSEWEDYQEILSASSPVIRVMDSGYERLQDALDSYCAKHSESVTEIYESWLPDAKSIYQSDKESFPGYYLESSAVPERTDDRIISFRLVEGSYFGGAHPNYFAGGSNFDPADGRALSLKDVVTDYEKLYEYAKQYLGSSFETDQLFPDCQETLDAYFYDPNSAPLQWIFDSEGLKLLFSPYDLGPYAMGSIEISVPYDKDEGLIQEKYRIDGKKTVKRIPAEALQEVDLNGDGTKEFLRLVSRDSETNGEPDYLSVVTVSTGTDETALSSTEYKLAGTFNEACLMRTEDKRSYLYVVSSGDNDYKQMEVFDLNGETPFHVGTVNDTPQGQLLFNPENFTLYTRLDALGTYNGRRHYRVGADGLPETTESVYKLSLDGKWERAITAKRTVPVWMETGGNTEEKVRTELPAGTRFLPVATDGETFVEMELEDGRKCEIRFETEDYPRMIEGVNEWEYFESLPYSG